MNLFERISTHGYEQVVFCHDRDVGLKAIIAIHDSTLGPGTGGCRMYPYSSEDAAVEDVLRLSRGMTYKAAISGLKLGGAKAVIIGDPKSVKSPALLRRFGQFVQSLNGRYITAKDVGINAQDLMEVSRETSHILGIEGAENSSGDPSPLTAWGVYNGMQACAEAVYGSKSLRGKVVALQGLGSVSQYLLGYLLKDGAKIIACDVDRQVIEKAKAKGPIEIVDPEKIIDQACDVFSPSALGGIINEQSMPRLKCKIVAGAANNQLLTDNDGVALMKRGIVYAPDYAINAGGLINIYHELQGYDSQRAHDHVAKIFETIRLILNRSEKTGVPPQKVADQIAEERIRSAKS
jgi:leucine dehydrogenase